MKDSDTGECRSLRELELEVEAEMREWGRQRLQEKLQEQADRHGRVFPPEPLPDVARTPASDAAAHQRGRT
jgi:hypothetical protein